MIPVITIADFIGVIALSANRFNTVEYDSYIANYTTEYINTLLGTEAYINLLTSINPKWAILLEGGTYEYVEKDELKYGRLTGFNEVLKYLIYFNIVRNDFTMSEVGAVNNQNENSIRVKQYTIAQDRYNKAVTYLKEVYDFIDRNELVVYPSTAVDNVGTYTITIDSLTLPYLEDGDTITINDDKVEYVISNLVNTLVPGTPDTYTTTFDITATGLTITSVTVRPFDLIQQADFKYSYL